MCYQAVQGRLAKSLIRCAVWTTILAAAVFWRAAGTQALGGSIFDDDGPSAPSLPKRQAPADQPGTPSTPAVPEPSGPAVVPPALPPDSTAPRLQPEIVPGLIAQLYDGNDFTRLKESRIVKRVHIGLTFNGVGVGEAPFCFTWKGLLNIPVGGLSASFQLTATGATEISIDGNVVSTTGKSAAVQLTEGAHPISIKVAHIKGTGGSKHVISLNWTPAGETTQVIPFTVFSHYSKDEPANLATAPVNYTSAGKPLPAAPAPAPTLAPVGVPAPPTVSRGELPVPTAAKLAEFHKTIKTQFATYYAQTGAVVRQALVQKLTEAATAATDPAERYALLKEASDQSAASGDVNGALAIDDTLFALFKVEEMDLKLATLALVPRGAKGSTTSHDAAVAAMSLSDRAYDAGDYDMASKLAQAAESAFTAAHEDASSAKARTKQIREQAAQMARIAPLLKKLKETPDDPDTNTKVGKYYCLTVGNYDKGLPLLLKGSDIALKGLAEVEASHPADAAAQIKLGDGWWDKAAGDSQAAKCKERACFWYDKARAQSAEELPEKLIQRLATQSRTIDLLPLVDLDQPSTISTVRVVNPRPLSWKRDHGALLFDGGAYSSELQLPYRPVGEYDFSVEFTMTRGMGTVGLLMPVRGIMLEWGMSQYAEQFSPLNLRRGTFGPILRGDVPMVTGRHYLCTVQFRRNGVRALINGTVIREWTTDYSDLGVGFGKRLADPRCLGLYCTGADVAISAIRVTEVPKASK